MTDSVASSSTSTGRARPPRAVHPQVHIRTFGCKVNRVESERIAAGLLGRQVEIVAEDHADLVIIDTCTVTAEADRKARKAIRHALELPREPVVVVTGCMAALEGEAIAHLGERVVVAVDKHEVVATAASILGVGNQDAAPDVRVGDGFRSRATVKVQDGCDRYCSYCIVPYARGAPRSVPIDEIISEVRELTAAGARELVLTGINLGRYRDESTRLPQLVEEVAGVGGARVRLSSIEPPDVSDELLRVLARTEAVCPHLHVPSQSGSDRMLQSMRRGYSVAEYEETMDRAREALPGLAVTTDVMTGFPGETDADASRTVEFLERVGFSRLHVFRYSPRKGTAAYRMPDQVDRGMSARRAERLRALGESLQEAYAATRLGGTADVLVEDVDTAATPSFVVGTTEDYLTCRVEGLPAERGEVLRVRLGPREGGVLLGRPL